MYACNTKLLCTYYIVYISLNVLMEYVSHCE